MSGDETVNLRSGFCIYINTFCQGPVPVVSDENGYVVFGTELEAQREIVDNLQIRLQEFLDGEREYEDAITVEEYLTGDRASGWDDHRRRWQVFWAAA